MTPVHIEWDGGLTTSVVILLFLVVLLTASFSLEALLKRFDDKK